MPNRETASSKRQGRGGDTLAVLLLLAVVAGIMLLWWHQKHSRKETGKSPAPLVQTGKQPQANQVVPSMVLVERRPETPTETSAQETATTPASVSSNVAPGTASAGPDAFPRPVENLLEAQVALARHGISPGCIDGLIGSQTREALAVFQELQKLVSTRTLDTNTQSVLKLDTPVLADYVVTSNDLARLQPIGKTWLAKSEQSALDYETILELVAEKAHAYRALIRKLNPDTDWTNVVAGTVIKIPDVDYPEPADRAAFVVIHLSDKFLEAFDTQSNLMAHFPCSIAAKVEKRPVGELHVSVVAPNPNYTFDPAIFPESPEAQAIGHKLILPPGPKNPVGVAWIGLDRPGYGIHGSPNPEQIGRTESHGCFRLANWDAAYLLKLVWVDMPVYVEP